MFDYKTKLYGPADNSINRRKLIEFVLYQQIEDLALVEFLEFPVHPNKIHCRHAKLKMRFSSATNQIDLLEKLYRKINIHSKDGEVVTLEIDTTYTDEHLQKIYADHIKYPISRTGHSSKDKGSHLFVYYEKTGIGPKHIFIKPHEDEFERDFDPKIKSSLLLEQFSHSWFIVGSGTRGNNNELTLPSELETNFLFKLISDFEKIQDKNPVKI